MKELILSNELKGIEESKAAQIKATFEPMIKMLDAFELAYSEIMEMEQSEEKSKKAKRLRIDIGKIRIETEKNRKIQKEEYLRAGKAIDGVSNIVKWAVTEKEESLKEIETFYERIEAERVAKIDSERIESLSLYGIDGSSMNLGVMSDEVWENLLAGSKAGYEAKKEAERKAEEERIERERKNEVYQSRKMALAPYYQFLQGDISIDSSEAEYEEIFSSAKAAMVQYQEKQEEIRKENERLKKEQEEKDSKAAEERKAQEEALRKEREAREAAERKAAEEKAEAERKERERLDLEQKEKEEQARIEREKKEAEEEARKKAELAPDKEKLLSFAGVLLSGKDSVKSKEAKDALSKAVGILTDSSNRM